jgi:hypothetical protein
LISDCARKPSPRREHQPSMWQIQTAVDPQCDPRGWDRIGRFRSLEQRERPDCKLSSCKEDANDHSGIENHFQSDIISIFGLTINPSSMFENMEYVLFHCRNWKTSNQKTGTDSVSQCSWLFQFWLSKNTKSSSLFSNFRNLVSRSEIAIWHYLRFALKLPLLTISMGRVGNSESQVRPIMSHCTRCFIEAEHLKI